MCDTIYDCEFEEDERFCTALTNTSYLAINRGGDPHTLNSGTLLLKQNGLWKPVCVSQMSYGMASTICSYMGYKVKGYKMVEQGRFEESVPTLVMGRAGSCKNVEITCDDDRCGQRPLYRNLAEDKTVPRQGAGRK